MITSSGLKEIMIDLAESNDSSKPMEVFKVVIGNPANPDRIYRIFANGTVEGFEDGDKAVLVFNRLGPYAARVAAALCSEETES